MNYLLILCCDNVYEQTDKYSHILLFFDKLRRAQIKNRYNKLVYSTNVDTNLFFIAIPFYL